MTWCLCPLGVALTIACCLCSSLAGRLQTLWTRQPESLCVALLLLQGLTEIISVRSSSPSRCWPIRSKGLQQGRGDPEISPRSRQLTARDLQVAPEIHTLLWLLIINYRYRPLMPRRSQAALPDFGWSHGLSSNLEICNSPLLRRLPNVQHFYFIN
jgi:hypothetical protein